MQTPGLKAQSASGTSLTVWNMSLQPQIVDSIDFAVKGKSAAAAIMP